MFSQRSTIGLIARQVAVASASLLLVASSLGYLLSPVSEALGASVHAVAAKTHHEAIEGKVETKNARGFVVVVLKRVHGHEVVVAVEKVGRNGRFFIRVAPGRYVTVIKHGHHQVSETVKVTSGHAAFIVVKVSHKRGGFSIAPVIFNY